MTKVDLITGILGAGKTTFIKKYAGYLLGKGLRIAILENDFGAVNVDMMILQESRSGSMHGVILSNTDGPLPCRGQRSSVSI